MSRCALSIHGVTENPIAGWLSRSNTSRPAIVLFETAGNSALWSVMV